MYNYYLQRLNVHLNYDIICEHILTISVLKRISIGKNEFGGWIEYTVVDLTSELIIQCE